MKKNLISLLSFLFLFSVGTVKAQFKAEANLKDLDLKSEYFDVAVRDTFGLKDITNIKGIAKLKYKDNSLYFLRNGLLNYNYGGDIKFKGLNFFYNNSRQNIKNESLVNQNFPVIGNVSTKTTILNKDRVKEFGVSLGDKDNFIGFDNAVNKRNINFDTLIDINGEKQSPVSEEMGFKSETNVYSAGFKYGFFKFIENKQDSNKFSNYFVKANYTEDKMDFNLYYTEDFAGFFDYNFFDKINAGFIYDKRFKFVLATSNFSKLNKRDLETKLENEGRVVPRVYDSGLETKRHYLEDMFYTDLYDFSLEIGKNVNFQANFHWKNFSAHYSKNKIEIGLNYKFLIGAYDFENKEFKIGIFLD